MKRIINHFGGLLRQEGYWSQTSPMSLDKKYHCGKRPAMSGTKSTVAANVPKISGTNHIAWQYKSCETNNI
jgi:ABC-type phosphate transport system substrate-binding protein